MAKMNNDARPCYAVLTGDIVNSSSLREDRRLQLYREMQTLSNLLKQVFSQQISHDLSNFRGDGWQLLLDQPQKALVVSIFIRTFFRYKFKAERLDSRVAVSIGPVDYVPEKNISEGFGPAFTESGLLLDRMKTERMQIALLAATSSPHEMTIVSLVRTFDDLISAWTAPQCQAVHLALQGYTQKEIGERWEPRRIAQPSVAKHLKSAQWSFVKNGITLFDSILTSVLDSQTW